MWRSWPSLPPPLNLKSGPALHTTINRPNVDLHVETDMRDAWAVCIVVWGCGGGCYDPIDTKYRKMTIKYSF